MTWHNLLWQRDSEILQWDNGKSLWLGDDNGHQVVKGEKLVRVNLGVASHWRLGKKRFGCYWKRFVGIALRQVGVLVLYSR